ncbi:formylglycine-generating enzyme family protein [Leptothoe spongobia]|uniref:Formylglycine-generating enzyme family protein n=1 Tax=Leptothoe spongobia TAU-MAC 1115 TaxID=1967444 RepID=A0A947DHK9_9CYAN|nr:formylglycine-generating enzyme family protein [Leptothoe spongobia]MBT9317302.1 formylglycine-generating enzyme family protein [Leptothoe spongobia TAU-MAC 1115]
MSPFTTRRTHAVASAFTEPLEGLNEAIPLDMILVRGGTFMMGSPEDELDRKVSEGPQHLVNVPDFFMGRYPITQAQWRVVAEMGQVNRPLPVDPSNAKGLDRPVEQVSWYDAVEFCARLARLSGRPYRLPSEAEWEYACRAGTQTPFSFGKILTPKLANYDCRKTYNGGPKGDWRRETTPVAQFGIANAWGLCDMHGNVHEWCQDHWHESYEGASADGNAWLTDNEGANRVRRGGSWADAPRHCRSAFRDYPLPGNRSTYIGFRVVCSAPRILP